MTRDISKDRCPPAFAESCVLDDETRCPYYHDGECVKAPEEADGQ